MVYRKTRKEFASTRKFAGDSILYPENFTIE